MELCIINNCVSLDAVYWFCDTSEFIGNGAASNSRTISCEVS